MTEDITVSNRESQPVVSTRFECTAEAMGVHLREMLPPVYAYVEQQGGDVAAPPFLRYHAIFDGRFYLELGIPVVEPLPAKSMMESNELPGGSVIVAPHVGPYRQLGRTHAKVRDWIRESDWEPAGPYWDFFLDDPRKSDDELDGESRRTRVCYPVQRTDTDGE